MSFKYDPENDEFVYSDEDPEPVNKGTSCSEPLPEPYQEK